jgi:hypothetical protein
MGDIIVTGISILILCTIFVTGFVVCNWICSTLFEETTLDELYANENPMIE